MGATQALLPSNQMQQQQMLIQDESDNYVMQRAETMQNIESTIVELGGIFQQLAHMVNNKLKINLLLCFYLLGYY